jgi:hypothetical protein
VPTFDRDHSQRTQHLRVDDVDDGPRIDSRERALGGSEVELDAACELFWQPAEQEVRVGDRALRPAASVTRRARVRAGALRPDAQSAPRVGPDERAAAGANGVQVDCRKADR